MPTFWRHLSVERNIALKAIESMRVGWSLILRVSAKLREALSVERNIVSKAIEPAKAGWSLILPFPSNVVALLKGYFC